VTIIGDERTDGVEVPGYERGALTGFSNFRANLADTTHKSLLCIKKEKIG